MSYDLLIGHSTRGKHSASIAGAIEFENLIPLQRIAKKHHNWLFDRLLNHFEDQTFTLPELSEAVEILDAAILSERDAEERRILYKITAIFSMALRKNLPVHGLSD